MQQYRYSTEQAPSQASRRRSTVFIHCDKQCVLLGKHSHRLVSPITRTIFTDHGHDPGGSTLRIMLLLTRGSCASSSSIDTPLHRDRCALSFAMDTEYRYAFSISRARHVPCTCKVDLLHRRGHSWKIRSLPAQRFESKDASSRLGHVTGRLVPSHAKMNGDQGLDRIFA